MKRALIAIALATLALASPASAQVDIPIPDVSDVQIPEVVPVIAPPPPSSGSVDPALDDLNDLLDDLAEPAASPPLSQVRLGVREGRAALYRMLLNDLRGWGFKLRLDCTPSPNGKPSQIFCRLTARVPRTRVVCTSRGWVLEDEEGYTASMGTFRCRTRR